MRTITIACAMLVASTLASVAAAYNSAVDALLDQARQHLVQGDFERADLVAQRIVRIDPDDARGWGLMAEILETQGNHAEAQQYRSRQRLASRQLNDDERDFINRNGTVDADSANSASDDSADLLAATTERYSEEPDASLERTEVTQTAPNASPRKTPVTDLAKKKPSPPVDGWVQSPQARPQNSVVDRESGSVSGRTSSVTTTDSSDSDRVSRESRQSRLNAVFARSGTYSQSNPQQDSRPVPARESQSQHQYSEREISQLERMRRDHRKQVSRLHDKLFGREESAERRASRPDDRTVVSTRRNRRVDSSNHVGSNDHNRSTASLVPAGYYPPPGSCRIWYYDLAPDQQPPSGSCRRLRSQLPVGARLLKGA